MNNDTGFKLDRCRYFERDWITASTKKEVAEKTNGRCARCGKKIKIGSDNFTVDHFIPLNKGGSNQTKNLIPLCVICNKEKTDDVTAVEKLYPYLKERVKKELSTLTWKFIEEYNWLTPHNFLMFDSQVIELPFIGLTSYRKGKKHMYTYNVPINIKKVHELDDRLLKFVTDYNAYYGYGTDFVENLLKETIDDGRMYIVTKNNDSDIKYAFLFKIQYMMFEGEDKPHATITIGNIMGPLEQSSDTNWVKVQLIYHIMRDLIQGADLLGLNTLDIIVETDVITLELLDNFKYYLNEQLHCENMSVYGNEEPGEFVSYIIPFIFGVPNRAEDISEEELNKLTSKSRKIIDERMGEYKREDNTEV